ncbi:MAG: sigma-70 family RNA polymerase sigma factor [Chitinophagales bacterium]|nr:sigma-70 family RNA polymerase sigma factor [Chitinophagales bacterium]
MQAITLTTTERMQGIETNVWSQEEKLILAAQADRAKFQPLYEKYYTQILKFVYQRVTTKDDAYDITQQVFLQAMVSLNKYELRGFPFSSWLYRIAINELNQAFRKNEKQRGVNLEEKHLKDIAQELNEGNEEMEKVLLEALTTLEEDDFQLVEMRFFEKRPFKEIGEILSITEANAKMKLYRILDKLKPILEAKLNLK